jgi:hypothetical protein
MAVVELEPGTLGVEARILGPAEEGVSSLVVTTLALPSGIVATPCSQSLSATGGVQPYSWSLTSGNLPPGLGLSSAGVIFGTPTEAGSFSFTVQVSDSTSPAQTATRMLTLQIVEPLAITTTSPLPAGTVGTAYSITFTAQGGTPPYAWQSLGSLPPGLRLNRMTGVLSGTPTKAGAFTLTIHGARLDRAGGLADVLVDDQSEVTRGRAPSPVVLPHPETRSRARGARVVRLLAAAIEPRSWPFRRRGNC